MRCICYYIICYSITSFAYFFIIIISGFNIVGNIHNNHDISLPSNFIAIKNIDNKSKQCNNIITFDVLNNKRNKSIGDIILFFLLQLLLLIILLFLLLLLFFVITIII